MNNKFCPPCTPGECPCGYYATCSIHTALHMILEHGYGDVAITKEYYSNECLQCFYGDLEPYMLVADNRGRMLQAARLGTTLMVLPQHKEDSANHEDKHYKA